MSFNYVYRFGVTAWRRKTTVLIVAGLLLIITIGLQYNRNDLNLNQINILRDEQKNNEPSKDDGVKFVDSKDKSKRINTDTKQSTELNVELLQNMEQPNRDDIASRQDEINEPNLIREIEHQLGIPYVNLDTKNPYIPKQRIVHFDLKGAPPKISYLKRIFPLIKTMGATGILLGTLRQPHS